ncbi:mechanosensitive ion channel family protein [Nocardia gipuzkoensis]|uniref:mechanosensitive ion channel family protein n=1 Tax=Nocardia gipuzkoensis TaxID=2749991 RepID=UPI003EE15F32
MHTSSLAIDFQQGFSDAWGSIATFVPKLVGFLVILLIGWLIAKAVEKIVDKVLERVGFDRAVERGGVRRMLERSKYDASDILARLAYYAVLLIALQIGFGVFGPNPVSNVIAGIVAWLPRLAIAIVIVVVAGAIAHAVREMVGSTLGGLSYGPMLARMAAVGIWAIGIVAALNQIGVATAVTVPILVAVLATVGGILVVGVGGGMIRPMQERWERWISDLEHEIPTARGHAEAYRRGREDAAREQMLVDQQAARGQQPVSGEGEWEQQPVGGPPQEAAQGRQWQEPGTGGLRQQPGRGATPGEAYPQSGQGAAPGGGYAQPGQGGAPGGGYAQPGQRGAPGGGYGQPGQGAAPGEGYPQPGQGTTPGEGRPQPGEYRGYRDEGEER